MKIAILFTLMMVTGILGTAFFFGDCESLVRFILSKPIGIMLLIASYKLFKSLKSEFQSTIQNNN